jgi:hypothetical protein
MDFRITQRPALGAEAKSIGNSLIRMVLIFKTNSILAILK